MILEKYLNWLDENDDLEESIFPIDSPQLSKKPLVIPEKIEEPIDPKRIMIDFDATIHKYSEGYKDGSIYDVPFDGIKEYISKLKKEGYEIFILTSRLSKSFNGEKVIEQKRMIQEWLDKYGIKVDGITSEKLPAILYIDDRGIFFKGKWDQNMINDIDLRLKNN